MSVPNLAGLPNPNIVPDYLLARRYLGQFTTKSRTTASASPQALTTGQFGFGMQKLVQLFPNISNFRDQDITASVVTSFLPNNSNLGYGNR